MGARITLLLALLATAGCAAGGCRGPAPAEGTFALRLLYRQAEISKDSNEQTTEIAIEGRRATYSWTYSGFHPDPDATREVHKRKRLSPTQLDAIQETIRTRDLLRDVEETSPAEDLGIAVTVELDVEMEGQRSTIRIQGMQRRWRDGGASDAPLAHASTVNDVEALVEQIRSIVDGR